jgi:hypothetical protein
MAPKNTIMRNPGPNQKSRRHIFLACLLLSIAGTILVGMEGLMDFKHLQTTQIKTVRLGDRRVKVSPDYMTAEKQAAQCGVYYFYHVGKCGGTSVRTWMENVQKKNPENITAFVNWWKRGDNGGYDWRQGINDMDDMVYSGQLAVGDKSWLSVHHHHGSPGLRFMMPRFRAWKNALQSQDCDLILATVLREPLSRARSVVTYTSLPREKFGPFFENDNFHGQGKYLLFNKDVKKEPSEYFSEYFKGGPKQHSESELSTEALDEVTDYLTEFDIVGQTTELDNFITTSERMTGWNELIQGKRPRRTNRYQNTISRPRWKA